MPCGHYEDGIGVCGETPTRRYLTGHRCARHTPAALAGRDDLVPDPDLTLDALRRKAGIVWGFNRNDSSLNDQRAIATGRRRSSRSAFLAAQRAETERKAARRR